MALPELAEYDLEVSSVARGAGSPLSSAVRRRKGGRSPAASPNWIGLPPSHLPGRKEPE